MNMHRIQGLLGILGRESLHPHLLRIAFRPNSIHGQLYSHRKALGEGTFFGENDRCRNLVGPERIDLAGRSLEDNVDPRGLQTHGTSRILNLQGDLFQQLLGRFFRNDPISMIAHFIKHEDLSEDDISRLERLLENKVADEKDRR